MPGGKKHHTAKFRSCVEKVMVKGAGESSAYAICTTSLKKAGEPIFEGAEVGSEAEMKLLEESGFAMRDLHLLGATGTARTETWNGKEYLVVPVVALMEGVIHAVNAETPEFVPFETLQQAAESWNNKPVTVGHPKKDGRQCSAEEPGVVESHGIGVIRNSRVDAVSKKMLQEAWVEKSKAKQLNPDLLVQLEAGQMQEVSVGAFVVTDGVAADHNGKAYKASWKAAAGDHLAFLPGGRGACSVAMGCGTHRAAQMHLVCAEALEVVPQLTIQVLMTLEGESLDQRMSAVSDAVYKEWNEPPEPYAYPQQIFDDYVIVRKGDDYFKVPYTLKDGVAKLGEATKVKMAYVAAELRTAIGARNSRQDKKMIQTMHDNAVALGAECDRGNYKTASAPLPPQRIKNEGGRWTVFSVDGLRRLGSHNTQAEAQAQLDAIARSLARQKVAS